MRCSTVHTRLVAYQDRELSPGEHIRVAEHLDACPDCARLEARLRAATPRAFAVGEPSDAQWAALDARLQEEFDRLEAEPPPRTRLRTPRFAWLWEEATLPSGTIVAYAAMLLLAVAWGARNWWTAQQLQVALAENTHALDTGRTAAAPVGPGAIEPDQFVPASWTPGEE